MQQTRDWTYRETDTVLADVRAEMDCRPIDDGGCQFDRMLTDRLAQYTDEQAEHIGVCINMRLARSCGAI